METTELKASISCYFSGTMINISIETLDDGLASKGSLLSDAVRLGVIAILRRFPSHYFQGDIRMSEVQFETNKQK